MQLIQLNPQQTSKNQKWIDHFETIYGFKFLQPAYEKVPCVSQLFKDERVIESVEGIEYYLLGTYPIDMGTNIHEEMHGIRHKFNEDEYIWHKEHNKLGIHGYGKYVGHSITYLNKLFGRDDLRTIDLFPNASSYPQMSFQQKLAFSSRLDTKLYELLEKLHNDYS